MNRQTRMLPAELEKQVRKTLEEWAVAGKVRRLWARDATLWTGADEASWLGWLEIAGAQVRRMDDLRRLAEDVRSLGFTRALVLGMGGSSLAPEVLKETFGRLDGFPEVLVLDSADPAQVKALERKVDLAKTLFIVSSKSGTTLEPNLFKEYFFERARQVVGAERAGGQFIAITDPGSRLQGLAEADRFRRVFLGEPSIGGRYSALSNFGMVPAAIMGLDVARFLERAEEMAEACAASVPVEKNPGAVLGGRASRQRGAGARGRGTPGRQDHGGRSLRPRRRVLPVGVRDGRRGLCARRQRVQPARRRGEQGRDASADGRVRENGEAAAGVAVARE